MKRLLCIIILFSLLLTGCSSWDKPSNLSLNCYKLGLNILAATDDYLDNKITAVVAAGQVQDLCRTLGSYPDQPNTIDHEVKKYCEMLSYTLTQVAGGDYLNAREIINTRNYLADFLGKSKRDK